MPPGSDDETIEQHTRTAIVEVSTAVRRLLTVFSQFIQQIRESTTILLQRRSIYFKPSVYSPLGLLMIIAGIYYFLQLDDLLLPAEYIFFFLTFVLLGYYTVRQS